MTISKDFIIDTFAALGRELERDEKSGNFRTAIREAVATNGWFTEDGVRSAVEAIRTRMLCDTELRRWLDAYPDLPVNRAKDVGVIMAGNIPLVGFFDLLCVLAAGHRCLYKPSSKDAVMTGYIASVLRRVWPDVPLDLHGGEPLDALIATGSDNTRRILSNMYRGIPSLMRGTRSSAAVLDGDESDEELTALSQDIFSYCGLGCRNVSHLALPRGYDLLKLTASLARHGSPLPKYLNNYRQRRAVLTMAQEPFVDGGFFILRDTTDFPADISEITYHFYDSPKEVDEWLAEHEHELQCVAGKQTPYPRAVAFGQTQRPGLTDYADGADTMLFLASLSHGCLKV